MLKGRVFHIILVVVHPAAFLDVELGTTLFIHRPPASTATISRPSEWIQAFMLFEFLDKELGLEFDVLQRTVTVLGDLYIGISLCVFTHVIGGDVIIIRAIQEHHHVSILLNGT